MMPKNWLMILALIAVLYYLFMGGSDTVEGYYPWWRRRLPWWRRKWHRNWWYGPYFWRHSYYPYYSYY